MLVTMPLNSRCCYSKVVLTLLLTCYGNLKYFKFNYVRANDIKLTLLL
jgi:hypothetical protein